ncbi:MAG: hypothetical protein ACRD0O_17735, partial [Acidimicrobiia bacterium]
MFREKSISRPAFRKVATGLGVLLALVPFSAGLATVTWSGYGEVPGGGQTDVAPAAVRFDDKLHLFARGLDDRIYVNVQDGDGWSGYGEVPGG